MVKQTKLIKFMLLVLIIIPIALLFIGVIQTFVLKETQNQLSKAYNNLNQLEQEYFNLNEKHKFIYNEDGSLSNEYLKEYYKHNGEGYGNEGDIDIIVK